MLLSIILILVLVIVLLVLIISIFNLKYKIKLIQDRMNSMEIICNLYDGEKRATLVYEQLCTLIEDVVDDRYSKKGKRKK